MPKEKDKWESKWKYYQWTSICFSLFRTFNSSRSKTEFCSSMLCPDEGKKTIRNLRQQIAKLLSSPSLLSSSLFPLSSNTKSFFSSSDSFREPVTWGGLTPLSEEQCFGGSQNYHGFRWRNLRGLNLHPCFTSMTTPIPCAIYFFTTRLPISPTHPLTLETSRILQSLYLHKICIRQLDR